MIGNSARPRAESDGDHEVTESPSKVADEVSTPSPVDPGAGAESSPTSSPSDNKDKEEEST